MRNKESIGFRITFGVYSIVILMAAFGLFAALQVQHIYAMLEEIASNDMLTVSQLGVIRAASQRQAVLIRDVTSYEDLSIQNAAIKTMKEANTEIDRAMAGLLKKADTLDASLAQLIRDINQRQNVLRPMQQAAISAVQEMKVDVANDKVYKELLPLQAELDTMLDKARAVSIDAERGSVTTAGEMVNRLIWVIGLCIALGAGLAVSIGWWLTRMIKEPIVHAVTIAQTVVAGDLNSEI